MTAFATATIAIAGNGGSNAIATLAPVAFGFANVVIAGMTIATVGLLVQGKLVPQAVSVSALAQG